MMDIFTTKESALIHLNSTRIEAGEIRVYRYYSITGSTDSFVVIGLQDGIGPDCYQILSKRKNLIVNIDTELPDASRLIQGQIHVCPVNGVYHMVYVEDSQRIDREISASEVYYVEDFDSGYMYYLDRYTCKKLDDYFSKVYIDLSNTNALYEPGKYPETTITVWKDNSDITDACQIGVTITGCSAIFDGSRTIRVTRMTEKTAKVVIRVVYRGNTYQETWNIQKVQEGIKGADAESWSVLSKNSFIREPDMQSTTFQVLYQSGTETSHLEVPELQNHGLRLAYEYSNGEVGYITTQDFEFEPRITDDNTELTFCIVRLLNQDSEVLSALTLPYLPNTSALESGQGVYKAIVFCRANEMPETPLGGSWDSPVPTTGQWTQEAPDGPEVLWTSTRIFTTDAKAPQDASWSTPSRISNTENLEVMYSTCQDSTIVGTPSTKPENWEAVVTGIAYFMAVRTLTNGVPGLWQVFAIHGIDGDASDYKNYIYYNSPTKPDTPVGSHPDGWLDFPDSDGIWWMCVGLFSGQTNELIGTWSNPIKVTGVDGDPGQDAPYLIYQYALGTSPTDAPTFNWSSSIPTVPKGMYLWQRSGTVIPPDVAPTYWNTPVRITGEQGEQGAAGTAITIDLTNEVSSVAADYEGNVEAGASFETTQVLLYNNGNSVNLATDRNVQSITINPDGVRASISRSGLVTVHSWTAPREQETATIVISVNYNYNTYTAVYSIQKVKSGSPGEDAVLYSIIPSTNVLRKVNETVSPAKLTAQVRKSVGPKLSNITNLASEGLELVYSVNGSRDEETYNFTNGIPTDEVDFVTLTLRSTATGSVIDKETVLTIESTIDLIVDLTNEVSAVSAAETGELDDNYSNFETSSVKIYYGSTEVRPSECQIRESWTNMTGTFDQTTGIITPSGWETDKLGESTGQCTLEVTYREFTKTVTYTVTKINSGGTTVLWSIVPSVSCIKATDNSVSSELITVKIYKIRGTERTEISPIAPSAEFRQEGIKLRYARTFEDTGLEAEKVYETHIPVTLKMNKVEITLYNLDDDVLDRESVYVIRDGAAGIKPDWKDYIFCKKDTQPNTPTFTKHPVSGTADNYGQVWHNGPTSGSADEIWWMSTATIDGQSSDDSLLSGTSWSTPVRVTGYDGTGYECQYTNSKNLVTPPESANWTDTPTTPPYGYYTWMRMRSTKDSAWKYMRITGERGSDGNSIIVKGDLIYVGNDTTRPQAVTDLEMTLIGSTPYAEGLDSYTGNIYQGQQMVSASRIANGDTYLYDGRFFICTGASGTMNTWQIVNVQGDPGESWMTYIAFASNKEGSDMVQEWEPGKTYMGVAVVNTSEHPDRSNVGAELYNWAEFHGQEGIGNEFIFARNDSDSAAPSLNENEIVNGKTKADDEYLPAGWTDDPQPVEDVFGHRVQWVSTRQKTNGIWGPFKTPVVWNRFAKDGLSINVVGSIQYVGIDRTSQQNYIVSNDYVPDVSTLIHGDLYLNNTKVTNVNNGDTYVYNGYFFICSGTTDNTYDWTITKSKGDKGDNSYVHIRYKNDDGTIFSDRWQAGCRWIGFVANNSPTGPDTIGAYTWSEFLGHDGPGQEFIYCLSDTLTTEMSNVASIDVNANESESSNGKRFQEDEFLPSSIYGTWTDDPQTVTREVGRQKQWVSTRAKNSSGVWSSFSTPSLWSEVGGSSYNMILGNQELKATYGGIGIPSPTLGSNANCTSAISAGDCSGTMVKYIKDDTLTPVNITVTSSSAEKVYVFVSGQAVQVISKASGVLSGTLENVSQFELFAECNNKSTSSWSVTLTSTDGVVKTMNVTRTAFEPKITLGTTVYGYTRDEVTDAVTYSPDRTAVIDLTYLSGGRVVSKSVFDSYGYSVRARYLSSSGTADQWVTDSNNQFTLNSIVGTSASPIDGSLEFEVYKGSESCYRETIAFITSDIGAVKTYLLDGNAAITGHLWAKDGKIGNWIINSLDTNLEDIKLEDGTVLASYDSDFPVGSLRSVVDHNDVYSGILLSPINDFEENPTDWESGINIWRNRRPGISSKMNIGLGGISCETITRQGAHSATSHTPFSFNSDGTGQIADGAITWDSDGLSVSGEIEATSGTIGGWNIGETIISGKYESEDNHITTESSVILDSSEENIGIRLISSAVRQAYWEDDWFSPGQPLYDITMTISPNSGFKIVADRGDVVDLPLAEIDMEGNGHFGNAISWNNSGSGWLANGNLSWDADGNIDIATKDSNGSPVGTHITTQGITITDPDLSDSYATTISRNDVKLKDSTEGIMSVLSCGSLSFGSCDSDDTILPSRKIMMLQGGADPYIQITNPGVGYSNMEYDAITLRKGGGVSEKWNIIQADDITLDGPVNATAFNTVSDETLKEKVSDIEISIEQIANAPAITYTWKSDDNKENVQAGTIAQYWKDVLPEVVIESKNGTLGLNYQSLATVNTILLAKEVIALRERIEELENKQ